MLADVAIRYPDPQVRVLAADRVRVAAGQLLPNDPAAMLNDLVQDVRRLVPEDRLLARDCQRYQEMTRWPKQPRCGAAIRCVVVICASWSGVSTCLTNVEWVSAAGSQEAAYVAGYEDNVLTLVRLPFLPSISERTVVSWPVSPSLVGAPVLLCPDPYEQAPLIAQVVGAAGEPPSPVLRCHRCISRTSAFGGGQFLTPRTRGVARSSDSLTWVVDQENDELALHCYSPAGRLLESHMLPCLPRAPGVGMGDAVNSRIRAKCRDDHPRVPGGTGPCCVHQARCPLDVIRMQSRVLDISVPPDDHPLCAIVRCRHEVVASGTIRPKTAWSCLTTRCWPPCAVVRATVTSSWQMASDFDVYVRGDGNFGLMATGTRLPGHSLWPSCRRGNPIRSSSCAVTERPSCST